MMWYHALYQLNIYKVEARLDLDNKSQFNLCFYFTDDNRFVCHAIARPFMKDRRTDKWMSIITLGISGGCEMTVTFKQTLKHHVENLAAEVLCVLTGDV